MPDTIAVKPAEGRSVRNPDRKFRLLQGEGELVPVNAFWLRRVAAGDVVEIAPADWQKHLDDRKAAAEKAEADAKAPADKGGDAPAPVASQPAAPAEHPGE